MDKRWKYQRSRRGPALQAHEQTCRRCGKCCWFTEPVPGTVHRRRRTTPCPFLLQAEDGCKCLVYWQRDKVQWCLPVEDALAQRSPPATCGYAPTGYESEVVDGEEHKHG